MAIRTLADFVTSLIGGQPTRQLESTSDAPRNVDISSEDVQLEVDSAQSRPDSDTNLTPTQVLSKASSRKARGRYNRMVLGRQRYAGLTDLDESAPEIYETPELTDDASTTQTATQRTTSPSPSDDLDLGRHDPDAGLDRQRLDRDEARRRFESSRVDARGVNFSDTLAGRKSYKTGTRRRRRRRDGGVEELGDLTDSEDESLGRKLARLKRETEEVKMELQKREEEKAEGGMKEEDEGLEDGIEALNKMLDGLNASSSRGGETSAEAALKKKIESGFNTKIEPPSQQPPPQEPHPQPSTLNSLASLSDRLTALENNLGLSKTSPTSTTPILPTLTSLTSQITTLATTLSPTPNNPSSSSSSSSQSSAINLSTLQTRIRDLISLTDRLTLSRKSATLAARDLRQARLRAATTLTPGAVPPPLSSYSAPNPHDTIHGDGAPYPLQPDHRPAPSATDLTPHHPSKQPDEKDHSQATPLQDLIHDSTQHVQLSALYVYLPTLRSLAPTLPLVLERLRTLQAVHAGAADARAELERLERGQRELEAVVAEWREGLARVEAVVGDWERNVGGQGLGDLGERIRGVEARLEGLERG